VDAAVIHRPFQIDPNESAGQQNRESGTAPPRDDGTEYDGQAIKRLSASLQVVE
jgi:hypothetical protein